MPRYLLRVRFAVITAAILGLLVSGVAIGAAGSALIIGSQTNNAGTADTQLITNSNVIAFKLLQNGPGTGLMGYATAATGATRGVYGRTDSPDGFGIQARNQGAAGNGAAFQAIGVNNPGILATSDETTAIQGEAGCTGFLCGATGVRGYGGGLFGAGVYGEGAAIGAGVYGLGSFTGVFGTNVLEGGSGVSGAGVLGIGVSGTSPGAGTIDYDCTDACWDFPGGSFAGPIGVIGQTDGLGPEGYSRGVLGIAGAGGTWGVYSQGDANVEGDLFVSGACTGCTAAALAQNGSNQAIAQGDAVTLIGVTTGADGSVVMLVGPAKHGDAVFGIADRAMALSAATATTKASNRVVQGIDSKTVTLKTPALTVQSKERKWMVGATSMTPNSFLRVVTSGILAYTSTGAGLTAGDSLAVGATNGKLTKAEKDAARGSVAGKFGGKLADGRVVIFVDPS